MRQPCNRWPQACVLLLHQQNKLMLTCSSSTCERSASISWLDMPASHTDVTVLISGHSIVQPEASAGQLQGTQMILIELAITDRRCSWRNALQKKFRPASRALDSVIDTQNGEGAAERAGQGGSRTARWIGSQCGAPEPPGRLSRGVSTT